MKPINNRILSLDVFRGLIIVLMIIVNSQSSSSYLILLHAEWNGFTLADLVFPAFLFIVGLTAVVSLNRHLSLEDKSELYVSIIKRSFILLLLGLFLNFFPWNIHWESFRVYGILQRIALCYLVCAIIYLNTHFRTQILLFLFILIAYWILMTQIPSPNGALNQLTAEGSWVSYFDQLLFSPGHLHEKTYDPEGFLSTFPAIATTLLGMIVGQFLLENRGNKLKSFNFLCAVGVLALIGGWCGSYFFPINKNLWTSTYVLWSGGLSILLFALCFLLIDLWGYERWAWPFKVFGMNALFAFIVHVLLLKIQFKIKFNNPQINLKEFITYSLFGNFSPENAHLLYSMSFLCLNFLLVFYLYKKKIFIRI